jgi:carbamoyl-phosphate synthase small subunit
MSGRKENETMRAALILEDGSIFEGEAFGHTTAMQLGEVVFNTGMTGYQEVLSDPSYYGQIVTMTYPLIGNYGMNRDDSESLRPYVKGFVVREHATSPSNWRSQKTLDHVLKEYEIPGISGIDTRKLTRKIRYQGTMKGVIATGDFCYDEAKRLLAQTLPSDQVAQVSTKSLFASPGHGPRIVLVDFGAKYGILRELTKRGCDTIVVPYNVTAEEIQRLQPEGILLSNGPGDPKDVPMAIEMIRKLLGKYPIFGICLGHQLFALACGADTVKMKFGHRGGNQPVKDMQTGKVYITSQNHSYAVKEESLKGTGLITTHISMNDGTIEGLRHEEFPAFSVQYHPEAAPGPYDSSYLFEQFLKMIMKYGKGENLYA